MAVAPKGKKKNSKYVEQINDYLREKAKGTLPEAPLCLIVARLFYEGDHVGYRIKISPHKLDVSIPMLNRFKRDFDMKIAETSKGVDINFIDKGDQLVPDGYPDVPEATYEILAECYHRRYMAVMDIKLKELYDEYNAKYFNNELPFDMSIAWSDKMLTSGARCMSHILRSGKGVTPAWSETLSYIRVAGNRRNLPLEELRSTIVHEMIHVKYPMAAHGFEFSKEMRRLNTQFNLNVQLKCAAVGLNPYVYVCTSCGKEIRTPGKLRTVRYCALCYGKGHASNGLLELDRVEK